MNRIRIAAAAAAMLIGAATVAEAQTPAPQQGQRGTKAHRGAHGMMDSLNLTNAQKDQIQAIHAKYRLQLEALRQQEHAEVRAVLTADQAAKFDAKHAQMRERMAQHDSSGKAHPRGMRGHRPMRGARPGRPPRPRGQN